LAVALAHPRGAFAAGSAGPLGTDPSTLPGDELRAGLYREQFEALVAGGVDALMLETFDRVKELVFAVRIAAGSGQFR